MKMKKILLLFFCLNLFNCNQNSNKLSQNKKTELKKIIVAEAKKASEGALKQDVETTLYYTHPNVLNKVGGIDTMRRMLQKVYNQISEKKSIKIESSQIGEVEEIVLINHELHCLVPLKMVLSSANSTQKLISEGYLVGISLDKGKRWYFVSADKPRPPRPKGTSFPDFETSLRLPKTTTYAE